MDPKPFYIDHTKFTGGKHHQKSKRGELVTLQKGAVHFNLSVFALQSMQLKVLINGRDEQFNTIYW